MKSTIALIFFSLTTAAYAQQYVIEKVNKGTHFLKSGQESAGYINNDEICGAQGGDRPGAEACALVTPLDPNTTEQKYRLQENICITCTPLPDYVGYIEGSKVESSGIGGNKATGVFRVE